MPAPPIDGVHCSFAIGDEFIPLAFLESGKVDEEGRARGARREESADN